MADFPHAETPFLNPHHIAPIRLKLPMVTVHIKNGHLQKLLMPFP